MKAQTITMFIYQFLLFTMAVGLLLVPSISYGQAPPNNLNEIPDTTGQDNLMGTNGDDLFILSGAGSRWNWDNVLGLDGTDYIQMPTSITDYVSTEPFDLGGYLFGADSSTQLGTVWADGNIEYLVFPEGIYSVEEAVGVVTQ